MKIIVVGAGASGVTAAINYKRNHPKDDVLIIEQLDKALKKILATGNGKCNLGHKNIDFNVFNNPALAKKVTEDYNYENFFDSISIKTKTVGDLAYPVSESAVSVREAFMNEIKRLNINLKLEERLIDYKVSQDKITVETNKSEYVCDKLILAGGLKSSSKLGSDGSVFEILKNHNYKIVAPQPGLAPLYTKEKTKELDGVRFKAKVTILKGNLQIHEEFGEVLFKEHGLSGIVIFNAMSIIARDTKNSYKLVLDLLPDYDEQYLLNYLETHSEDQFLLAFINPKFKAYLKRISPLNHNIVQVIKHLEFTYDKSYGFDFSQVSVGGVSTAEVNDNFMSKHEPNVFIIGELLDVDGPCGGYNLTWAFASAIKATK